MGKMKFKTETKRLLDLMINSIYTNKEIFLRELISNASDAIDKYHFLSLTNSDLAQTDYEINISIDEKNRTLTIKDNGIGMTYDELNNNLGTIAKSGSADFMQAMNDQTNADKIDIIGQFGVGFYSAFMVSKKIVVLTKSPFSDKGYKFVSKGEDSYEVNEYEKSDHGTEIILHLRENPVSEEKAELENFADNFNEFLEEYTIKSLVKKYSDYVRYPITMLISKQVPIINELGEEDKEKTETKFELETLNSMIPIWKKLKSEVKEEDINSFYKSKFYDYQDPFSYLHIHVEGSITYNSLVFIPQKPPHDLYSEKFEKGLQLYVKGVFIMDKCKDLLPDYLRFVKGLVDSADLSLNISREILQQTHQLEKISVNIEKKVISELEKMLKNDWEKYLEFFKNYGVNLKYGVYDKYGEKKEMLQDLLVYETINGDSYITLKEYVEKMLESQEVIYYASGKTKEAILAMPQMDLVKKQGFDVLILKDEIDEFVFNIISSYQDKKLKSVNQGDLDLLSKEEKEKIEELKKEKQSLLEKLKELLKDDVSDVILSNRLTDSPVCLVSGEGVSFEMEKILSQMPNGKDNVKASKVLEINPNHQLFNVFESLYANNDESLADYATLLYDQALLMEGFTIKDPVSFSKKMCELMIKSNK